MANPLLNQTNELPRFSSIEPQHILTAINQTLDKNIRILRDLLAKNSHYTWKNLIAPLEESNDHLNKLWSIANHLINVVNSKELRRVYKICLPKISTYHIELRQNEKLYHAVKSIAQSPEYAKFDVAQKKILENMLRDFRLTGASLDKKHRQHLKQLQCNLANLQNNFSENVLDAINSWRKLIVNAKTLSGLPNHALDSAKENAKHARKNGWLLDLQAPCYEAVITFADNRSLRREIYLANITKASPFSRQIKKFDNSKNIIDILKDRYEIAQLLDFKNYAEFSLATKMVKNPRQVLSFLNNLARVSKKKAQKESQELKKFAKLHLRIEKLEPWDIAYSSEKLRAHKYALREDEIRQYFPEHKVIRGLFTLVERLFAIKFDHVANADVWHKDVQLWKISNSEKKLGYLYLDLYARPNKRSGAWMDSCQDRRRLTKNQWQLPVAYLICNFQPPTKNKQTYLNHYEVETLFHELGHALQHLLTQVDYAPVSGTNGIPWDAVEFASQFLEKWSWERKVLQMITQHKETNLPLLDHLFKKMRQAKNYQSGLQMLRQIEFSLFDFLLHIEFSPREKNQVQKIFNAVRDKVRILPTYKFDRMQNSFLHIFAGEYAAGYYSYKWAEVLAADAFLKFQEQGLFNKKVAQSFLQNILAPGGSVDPLLAFKKFRSREPKLAALLKQSAIK